MPSLLYDYFRVVSRTLWCFAGLGAMMASAQTDEIQVYTGELAAPGEFTLTLHNNYTPLGRKIGAFAGGIRPDGTLNGVPEWAYGVNDFLEVGTYLAVYSVSPGGHSYLESAKLRALFAVPHSETRRFFYGMNFELSRNARRWEESRYSGEIRPIIGTRFGSVDIILNPILDSTFHRLSQLEFAPSLRVAYNASPKWAFALEHYSDLGSLRHFVHVSEQGQSLFGVVDYNGKTGVEFGIGHGFNDASDKVVIKLMLSSSLNRRQKP